MYPIPHFSSRPPWLSVPEALVSCGPSPGDRTANVPVSNCSALKTEERERAHSMGGWGQSVLATQAVAGGAGGPLQGSLS